MHSNEAKWIEFTSKQELTPVEEARALIHKRLVYGRDNDVVGVLVRLIDHSDRLQAQIDAVKAPLPLIDVYEYEAGSKGNEDIVRVLSTHEGARGD